MINGYPTPPNPLAPNPGAYRNTMATSTAYRPFFNPYPIQAPTVPSTASAKQPTLKGAIQNYPTASLITALIGGLSIGYLGHRANLWTKFTSLFTKPSTSASKPTAPLSAENIESIEEMEAFFKKRYPDRHLYDRTITQNYRNRPEIGHLTHVEENSLQAIDNAMWEDLQEYGIEYFDDLYNTAPIIIFRQHPALQGMRRD